MLRELGQLLAPGRAGVKERRLKLQLPGDRGTGRIQGLHDPTGHRLRRTGSHHQHHLLAVEELPEQLGRVCLGELIVGGDLALQLVPGLQQRVDLALLPLRHRLQALQRVRAQHGRPEQ